MMIFSLVAMTGLEKCCITSANLQWLCHSGERPMASVLLVFFVIVFLWHMRWSRIWHVCLAPNKLFISVNNCLYFSYFSTETYIVEFIRSASSGHFIQALIMSNHNIFSWRNKKPFLIPLLSGPSCSKHR